ncbi:MAG: dioxygenase [Cyanobacteria bacterium RYN_339]|nr:dioxygenase [Cyanobacteria bacterium RYN_339]
MSTKLPTYFVSHGGGPWPWMKQAWGGAMDELERSLQAIAREIGAKPKAVLVISGHWEEREFTVQASPRPPMVYDYSGFPAHTYQVQYPAPGSPELATRVQDLLVAAGIPVARDERRGYDHGTFTPLVAMYPDADVPVVQLSLKLGYDPEAHLALGRALAPLREEGVLIIGSGLSYHNLRRMGPEAKEVSAQFDGWLQQALVAATPGERVARLLRWEDAPAARLAHPEEDHLIPLMVAVGAAEAEPGACVYHEGTFFGNVTASSFRFGAVA